MAEKKVAAKKTVKKAAKKASKKVVKKVAEKAPAAKKATTKKVAAKKTVKKTVKKAAKKSAKKVNAQRKLRTIELNYYSPESTSVEVAGTFNKWKPAKAKMTKGTDNVWTVKVELEPGNYEYKLVFDGEFWEVDPNAPIIQSDLGPNNILQVD
jgi:1,4-alpha-glucan branching enzyme